MKFLLGCINYNSKINALGFAVKVKTYSKAALKHLKVPAIT